MSRSPKYLEPFSHRSHRPVRITTAPTQRLGACADRKTGSRFAEHAPRFLARLVPGLLVPGLLVPVLLAAVVAGCGRSAPGARPAKLPAALAQATALGGGLNAGGEAPLWALQIRPKTIMFTSQQIAAITLKTLGPQSAPNGGAWTGEAAGRPFRAVITTAPCRDEATGLTYPFSAQVEALGLTYRGCAAKEGQGLGPRR